MKIVAIGCTHAGTAAIVNAANLYRDAEITVYERNNNISFLSCGIALYVGGMVEDVNGLFYSSPQKLNDLGVTTKMLHDVIDVDLNKKEITVKNLETNEIFNDTYDKLIITSGSWPIIPRIDGINSENILLCKNFNHAKEIIAKAHDKKQIVVIGGGYIGVELVEAFETQGKKVTLIDGMDRIMSKYLDPIFTDVAQKAFTDHGVELALGQTVQRFESIDNKVSAVVTDRGRFETDLVILCIGFRPNTDLFKGKIDMLGNGAIIVNEYMQTSQEDVFAAGDCCAIKYNPTDKMEYIPLATNAIRMGLIVAKNLVKPTLRHMGTQGTSGIKIYDYNIASTGLTENVAVSNNLEVSSVVLEDNYRPEFMPNTEKVLLKLVYDKNSHVVLGGQICSKYDLTQMMNTLSVCIQNKMTMEELGVTDFFFQPHYNKPWSLLNIAANKVG